MDRKRVRNVSYDLSMCMNFCNNSLIDRSIQYLGLNQKRIRRNLERMKRTKRNLVKMTT